jgi:hypothetical protein
MWDKPKKKQSTEVWKEDNVFDGGPPGGFVPNMGDEDTKRWKAKVVGTKTGYPQVEIRKSVKGSQLLVIVNLGEGYSYKNWHPGPPEERANGYKDWGSTQGINIHLSMNGGFQMTFAELEELHQAVAEAKAHLGGLTNG